MKYRRIIAVILSMILLVGMTSATAEKHKHEWHERGRVDATCTEEGRISYYCSCGKTKTEPIPALGHKWDGGAVTTAATCAANGIKTFTCTRCGATKTEQLPTLEHEWGKWQRGVDPTCEGKGKDYSVCANCGQTRYRDNIDPLGHDWDEGTIIQPTGFLEDGEILYTCKRDPSHTKTEKLPVESTHSGHSIMDMLRNGLTEDTYDECDLHIVKQPIGGRLDKNGDSFELSIEVEGGEEPYTFKWRRRYNSWFSWWQTVEEEDHGAYEADMGNYRYCCIVTDHEGHKVCSDIVSVDYNLYIAEQPKNANLYNEESVTLSCIAKGGTPFEGGTYMYSWYDEEGNQISFGNTGEVTVSEEGKYYCVVQDSESDPVTSFKCMAYNAGPLHITTDVCPDQYLGEGEESDVCAGVFGGVEPYAFISWSKDGENIETERVDDDYYLAHIICDGSKEAEYILTAIDDMGDVATATTRVFYKQLEIAQQPESGTIPTGGGTFDVTVVMAEGEEPFDYTLYRDGKVFASHTDNTFPVTAAGEYYYHIEDASGRWADSSIAVVRDPLFKIDHIDVSGEIHNSEDSVTLTAVVEVGVEPITFDWWLDQERNGKVVGSQIIAKDAEATLTVSVPGLYWCHAKDSSGVLDRSKEARVEYSGEAPIIIKQPQNVGIDWSRNYIIYQSLLDKYGPDKVMKYSTGNHSATLSCEAIAGDGSTECLSYEWEYKTNTGWFKSGDKQNTINCQYNPYGNSIATWRCIVTDTRNNEKVTSNEATFSFNLAAEMNIDKKTTDTKLNIVIAGGKSPYRVKIYMLYPYQDNNLESQYEEIVRYDYYLEKKKEEGFLTGDDILVDSSIQMHTYNPVTQSDYTFEEYVGYYSVVTDASGQSVQSNTVWFGHPTDK